MSQFNWLEFFLGVIATYAMGQFVNLTTNFWQQRYNQYALKLKFRKLNDLKTERERISQKAHNVQEIYLSALSFILASRVIYSATAYASCD